MKVIKARYQIAKDLLISPTTDIGYLGAAKNFSFLREGKTEKEVSTTEEYGCFLLPFLPRVMEKSLSQLRTFMLKRRQVQLKM